MCGLRWALLPKKQGIFFAYKRLYLGKLWTPFVQVSRQFYGEMFK